MYNETTPSFPYGFCFLSGRGLTPDRFPRLYVLVSALLQRLLCLNIRVIKSSKSIESKKVENDRERGRTHENRDGENKCTVAEDGYNDQ